MKHLSIGVLAFAGILSFNSCMSQNSKAAEKTLPKPVEKTSQSSDYGLSLADMDKSVRPQDDFYDYVNGTWMKTAKIPSDKTSWGSFNKLAEDTDNHSMTILNSLLTEKFAPNSEGQKIQDLYATYMDTAKRNADGLNPIKADLAKVDAIQNLGDLQKYLDQATPQGNNPFYAWGVDGDLKDSKMNAVYLGDGTLGLGRDYYQKSSPRNTEVIAEYTKYVATMLGKLGYTNPAETAAKIVAFEKSMAMSLLTNEQMRDTNLQYNPKTLPELKVLVKNVDLPGYLKSVGVNSDRVIIGELKYYQNLDKFINTEDLPLIKDYLKYNLLSGSAQFLSEDLDNAKFDFYSKYLRGQKEQRALNKRGYQLINGVLGEAFGKLYVEKYFPAEAKTQMEELIGYLKKSFAMHINDLKWMSSTTKAKALEKLNKFTVKVAYPDKWKDYSKLDIKSEAEGGSLYSNLENVAAWQYQRNLDKIGKPVDKSEWGMTPQTVNAYYNPVNNEIVFPAAILQPPFFNFKADPAINFGGIGAVIGHEMTHGFDDQGAQFDGDGNLKDWWTPEDKANFTKVTKALAAQYDKYEPVKGTFVNGTFTNGENIADLGGVNIAFDALQMYLKDHGTPGKISGYTQNQRFFLSWGTVWRTLATDQSKMNAAKTDPHSPGYFRSFGPLVNTDAFYKAFDLKPGDKLYKAPDQRIKIW
ncbi:putative endopeptidase [Halpernia humi]|uniref:Putative endopeptidase n=1 Tax=Halpernia humi TaxID=493375 RepID=A0A1H5TVA2_9FLAO|nr:M13 family metallopeptidase [Halpernia humi]SEF65971.1 putative endopeptidase [Halpernia humi]